MKKLKVILDDRSFSASDLLIKGRDTVQNFTDHPTIFTNPNPPLPELIQACDELETAIQEAFDGGKRKTAIRNEKQQKLHALLLLAVSYVEHLAAGNEETVHLSGFGIKKSSVRSNPDFAVEQGDHAGSVSMRVKARKQKTMYRWEHSLDAAAWINDGITSVCKTTIDNLAKGVYWFRVVLIDSSGEHEQARLSFAVN